MKNNHRKGRSGFTLIELLAVITIIVILAGLVVGGMGYVNEKQARSKAQTQVQLLSKAIEEYKLEMGFYPPTVNKTSASGTTGTATSSILYVKLFYEGYDFVTNNPASSTTNPPKATRIYLADLDPTTSKQGWVDPVSSSSGNAKPPVSTTIKDPWGNEYCYRAAFNMDSQGKLTANSGTMNPDFDLWSMGKDGQTNAGSNSSANTDAKNRDDIRNF